MGKNRRHYWAALGMILAIVMLTVVFVSGCGEAEEGIVKGTLSHSMPEEHHLGVAMRMLADKVYEKSDGTLQLEVFPAGQFYTDKDMMQAVEAGLTDIGMAYHGWWSGAVPCVEVLGLPFLFDTYEHVDRAVDEGLFDIIDRELAAANASLLIWAPYGFGQICVNKEAIYPDDYTGLKLRSLTMQDAEIVKAIGAAPVSLGGGEVFMALQRGTVDGAIVGATSIYLRKHYEVTSHLFLGNLGYGTFFVPVNLDWWNSLSGEHQDIMREVAQEIQDWLRVAVIEDDEAAIEAMRQTGEIEIIDLRYDDEVREVWREAMQPVYVTVIDMVGDIALDMIKIADDTR